MNISMIAQLAEVSTATVSRYLNNGYVSSEKKEVIRRAKLAGRGGVHL